MQALFRDRSDAGRKLSAELAKKYSGRDLVVLAVPRGGVPVGYEVAKALNAGAFDVIITRKIPIPQNPEAGFGAVTSTGEVVLNQEVLNRIHLPPEEIIDLSEEVYMEIKRRMENYRGDRLFPLLDGKTVILVDDGMASGFTMVAAARSVKKFKPAKVIVAVPVAPVSAVKNVLQYVDGVVTLWSEPVQGFAVASFYDDFPDVSDGEVMDLLEKRSNGLH